MQAGPHEGGPNDKIDLGSGQQPRASSDSLRVDVSLSATVGFIVCVVLVFVRGRYRAQLGIALILMWILFSFYNLVYICAARLLGICDLAEFGVGLGSRLIAWRINGVIVRLNFAPIGSYVKLRSSRPGEPPAGLARLSSAQRVLQTISAPAVGVVVGWIICAMSGLGGAPVHAFRWLTSGAFVDLRAWRESAEGFLVSINSLPGTIRAFGILMLGNGIINVLPLPPLSGGILLTFIGARFLREKLLNALLTPLAAVVAITAVIVLIIGTMSLLVVIFPRGIISH